MSKRLIIGAIALVFAASIVNTAEARRYHRSVHHVAQNGDQPTFARGHLRKQRHRRAQTFSGGRPRAWCGWWLGHHLGMSDRKLWLARNWAQVGHNVGRPEVGAVVVWRHHVGIITGRAGDQWIIKSGNDGRGVRERPRSIAGAIAFRRV